MSYKIAQWIGLVGITATIPLVQVQGATAKTSVEIAETAKEITVLITEPDSVGSGVILQRQGDIYTVITAAHVVKNKASFKITTPDDQSYQIIPNSIRAAPGSIDLAIVKFKSTAKYRTAKLGNCNILKSGMDLYVAGFPGASRAITQSVFVFREGKVSANSTKTFENGYSLIYSNDTLPGMSGGAVLNSQGELIAIHGRGDRDTATGAKNGFNLGIPINRFATVASNLGVQLDGQVAPIPQNAILKADDYFASAVQKDNKGDNRGALADYNQAIALDPKFAPAYNNRGNLKADKLNDVQGAFADYNQAIALNPKFADAYNNRGNLKADKLNDVQGALADFNQAIALDPKNVYAYTGRGTLKAEKLNDLQGALTDYNQVIAIDPKSANAYTYRGVLKYEKLNDVQGALADYTQAISLDPKSALTYTGRGNLKYEKLNDVQGALADYTQAISLDSKSDLAYTGRGVMKSQKFNDVQGALADLSQAIRVNPNSVRGYYNRGDLFYSAGNRSAAITDFRKVAELDQTGHLGLIAQGIIQTQQGAYPQAINLFNQAAKISPESGDIYKYRGEAFKQQGDRTAAIRDWRKAAQGYKNNSQTKDYQMVLGWLRSLGAGK
jgi:tetratricopeptide (TPR) repeat protein